MSRSDKTIILATIGAALVLIILALNHCAPKVAPTAAAPKALAAGNEWFMAPDAVCGSGHGTLASPWCILDALDKVGPTKVKPGDVIWARLTGDYTVPKVAGKFVQLQSKLMGTQAARISVRPYEPDRTGAPSPMAKLIEFACDQEDDPQDAFLCLEVAGNWTDYVDFHISYKGNPKRDRVTTYFEHPDFEGGFRFVAKPDLSTGQGNRLINAVINDTDNAVFKGDAANDIEIYGLLSYNNDLLFSLMADVDGTKVGPFDVPADQNVVPLSCNNGSVVAVPLASGRARTTTSIVQELNSNAVFSAFAVAVNATQHLRVRCKSIPPNPPATIQWVTATANSAHLIFGFNNTVKKGLYRFGGHGLYGRNGLDGLNLTGKEDCSRSANNNPALFWFRNSLMAAAPRTIDANGDPVSASALNWQDYGTCGCVMHKNIIAEDNVFLGWVLIGGCSNTNNATLGATDVQFRRSWFTQLNLGYYRSGCSNVLIEDSLFFRHMYDQFHPNVVNQHAMYFTQSEGTAAKMLVNSCVPNTTFRNNTTWGADGVTGPGTTRDTANGFTKAWYPGDGNVYLDNSKPAPETVKVTANAYRPGSCNVGVLNGANKPALDVDLTACGLAEGASYEVRYLYNYMGAPVKTGTYTAGSPKVTLSMLHADNPMANSVGHIENGGPNSYPEAIPNYTDATKAKMYRGAFVVLTTSGSVPLPTPPPTPEPPPPTQTLSRPGTEPRS